MMKHAAAFLILLLAACTAQEAPPQHNVVIGSPQPNELVTSPLTVTGEARGTWYFEASFPVKLLDEQGNVIVEHYAQAQSDWMTENFVPFESVLTFTTQARAGTLVLMKDNPSGLPENDASVQVPVRFK
jgi:hypothetical protein